MQPLAYDPRPLAVLVAGGLLITAGCATPADPPPGVHSVPGSAAPSGPITGAPPTSAAPSRLSRIPPPTPSPPPRPPRKPSDDQPADRIAGRVIRGGSGPCYTVVTDDGREYALHGPTAGTLPTGSHVRVRLGPPSQSECGPGIPASIVSVELVN